MIYIVYHSGCSLDWNTTWLIDWSKFLSCNDCIWYIGQWED